MGTENLHLQGFVCVHHDFCAVSLLHCPFNLHNNSPLPPPKLNSEDLHIRKLFVEEGLIQQNPVQLTRCAFFSET